jgi:hypothetical protein
MLSYKLAITGWMHFYWFIREAVADSFNKYDENEYKSNLIIIVKMILKIYNYSRK